jgi:hypothetical protein
MRRRYLSGYCTLRGFDLWALDARSLLDVVEAVLVEHGSGWTNVEEVLDAVEAIGGGPTPAKPDRETWGTDAAAQEGQRAMMTAMPRARPR